jgi:16S rRNA (guanine527-N7)-methyltransferase
MGSSRDLLRVLEQAQALGMVGPGPIEHQVEHARALAELVGAPARFLDLGAGGGVPGLVLAHEWAETRGVLLDSNERKCRFLGESIAALLLDDRVQVACGRAETLARSADLRGAFDLVVARGFGRPAVTAECAVAFLEEGGRLAVSEPPADGAPAASERWSPAGMAELGYGPVEVRRGDGATVAIAALPRTAAERWPRRDGIPAKRPLWA